MRLQVRPIDKWPNDRPNEWQRSRFDTHWYDTESLLEREVEKLGGDQVILELDVNEADISIHGTLKGKRNPTSPRVAISFETREGPIKFHCSRFDSWRDNVRAIALSLEALRKVDRYGVTNKGEQYTGWRALGSGRVNEAMDRDTALRVIADLSGYDDPAADLEAAFREAAKHAHPDLGGTDAAFVALTEAREVLAS